MNRTFTFSRRFNSSKSMAQVAQELAASLMMVGGAQYANANGIHIQNGKIGVDMNFIADLTADIQVIQAGPEVFDVVCVINTTPTALFWVGVVGGFCSGGLFWVLPVLYFVNDPQKPYAQAIDRVAFTGAVPPYGARP